MPDIPLSKMMLVWNPIEDLDGPRLKVVQDGGDDQNYLSSWGACNDEFVQASSKDQILMLLAETVNLTVNEGIDPKEVHEALMVVPEYRSQMEQAAVIPPSDE